MKFVLEFKKVELHIGLSFELHLLFFFYILFNVEHHDLNCGKY